MEKLPIIRPISFADTERVPLPKAKKDEAYSPRLSAMFCIQAGERKEVPPAESEGAVQDPPLHEQVRAHNKGGRAIQPAAAITAIGEGRPRESPHGNISTSLTAGPGWFPAVGGRPFSRIWRHRRRTPHITNYYINNARHFQWWEETITAIAVKIMAYCINLYTIYSLGKSFTASTHKCLTPKKIVLERPFAQCPFI